MGKQYFSLEEIQTYPNPRYPTDESHQVHFHFRPARPADLCVTRDKETGEINISAGTIGPLTWEPYTMCLHINRTDSPHSYKNLEVGTNCVIGMPSRKIVAETWYTALPVLRGVNEFEVAGLHEFPSKWVDLPSIVECPVNFECAVEFRKDYYTHVIVFVRVIGASIDEEVLSMTREESFRLYPTYECDDLDNGFGGRIDRLSVMGEVFSCHSFPRAPKTGFGDSFMTWMADLRDEKYLTCDEYEKIEKLTEKYNGMFQTPQSEERLRLKAFFTDLPKMIIRDRKSVV
jgi:flavin reductase (DIM6/NTAB) family NADH-FMN oxidoreductase RutF